MVNRIFEDGSLESDEQIQEFWAGLIASSAEEYPNDNNIIYFEILRQLTKSELLLLKYFCENSEIETNPQGIVQTKLGIIMDAEQLFSIVNSNDLNQLNTEINHLKGLDLVEQGFGLASGFFEKEDVLKVGLKMSPLAINLLRKCF